MNAPAGEGGLAAKDRLARDDMIQATLAFMRRDIDNDGLDQRVGPYLGLSAPSATVRMAAGLVWSCYDEFHTHAVPPHLQDWDSLRRILAFLKTDRPLREEAVHVRHWRRWVALAALGVLAAAAAVALARDRFEDLAIPWVALGMAWMLIWPYPDPPQEVKDRWRYMPFRDRADWEAHEPLLRDLDVPAYALHTDKRLERAVPEPWWEDLDWKILALLGLPLVLVLALPSPSWTVPFAAPQPDAAGPGPDPRDAGVQPASRQPPAPPSAT